MTPKFNQNFRRNPWGYVKAGDEGDKHIVEYIQTTGWGMVLDLASSIPREHTDVDDRDDSLGYAVRALYNAERKIFIYWDAYEECHDHMIKALGWNRECEMVTGMTMWYHPELGLKADDEFIAQVKKFRENAIKRFRWVRAGTQEYADMMKKRATEKKFFADAEQSRKINSRRENPRRQAKKYVGRQYPTTPIRGDRGVQLIIDTPEKFNEVRRGEMNQPMTFNSFRWEVAANGRTVCRQCGKVITKGENAIVFTHDFYGGGSGTTMRVQIHAADCSETKNIINPLLEWKAWSCGPYSDRGYIYGRWEVARKVNESGKYSRDTWIVYFDKKAVDTLRLPLSEVQAIVERWNKEQK